MSYICSNITTPGTRVAAASHISFPLMHKRVPMLGEPIPVLFLCLYLIPPLWKALNNEEQVVNTLHLYSPAWKQPQRGNICVNCGFSSAGTMNFRTQSCNISLLNCDDRYRNVMCTYTQGRWDSVCSGIWKASILDLENHRFFGNNLY